MTDTPTNPAADPAADPDDAVLAHIVTAVGAVAPDVIDEVAGLDRHLDFFEEFGLDSMDRLSIMTALSEATGKQIAEQDYPELTTLDRLIAHLR